MRVPSICINIFLLNLSCVLAQPYQSWKTAVGALTNGQNYTPPHCSSDNQQSICCVYQADIGCYKVKGNYDGALQQVSPPKACTISESIYKGIVDCCYHEGICQQKNPQECSRMGGMWCGYDTCNPVCKAGFDAEENCTACPSGKYSSINSPCNLCDRGYGKTIETPVETPVKTLNKIKCLGCAIGKYKSVRDQLPCKQCQVGKYSNTMNASVCKSCETGKYSSKQGASTCKSCDAGRYSTGTGCTECDVGYYSSRESSMCSLCASGQYIDRKGASKCEKCPIGKYPHHTTCSACPEGKSVMLDNKPYQQPEDCSICDVGYEPDTISSSCSLCTPGKAKSIPGNYQCNKCESGKYSYNDPTKCDECATGKYSTPNATECNLCLPGYKKTKSNTFCEACPGGKYSLDNESSECKNCTEGTYSADGSSECTTCSLGKFALNGSDECTLCDKGYKYISPTATPTAAPTTVTPTAALITASPTATPTAAPTTASETCTLCDAGYYKNTQDNKIWCSPCPNGKSSDAGAPECGNTQQLYFQHCKIPSFLCHAVRKQIKETLTRMCQNMSISLKTCSVNAIIILTTTTLSGIIGVGVVYFSLKTLHKVDLR